MCFSSDNKHTMSYIVHTLQANCNAHTNVYIDGLHDIIGIWHFTPEKSSFCKRALSTIELYNLWSSISVKFILKPSLSSHSSSIGIVPLPSSVGISVTAVSLVSMTEQRITTFTNTINIHVTIINNGYSTETQINTRFCSKIDENDSVAVLVSYLEKRLSSLSSTSTSQPEIRLPWPGTTL